MSLLKLALLLPVAVFSYKFAHASPYWSLLVDYANQAWAFALAHQPYSYFAPAVLLVAFKVLSYVIYLCECIAVGASVKGSSFSRRNDLNSDGALPSPFPIPSSG